ncbi:glycosyltransferase family 4 protein [Clostridium perfringens]|jgi:glycosyltransferase involved in cell wall biosynthesis|uniref:glycosyltransferase family 4 protein n=1 Tax=Clostridium perfringens TaxID=1502 RepID=UPI001A1A503C|nr:glycosyltransferase family 4 protein [Clostridium perfringens]EHR0217400.1 glycosyltransferase family 4 protein [Clostridium perfringens]EHR0219735.1 glycosyltransferase family 4 protein [Clostridium perfringens]EJT6159595.1 glycosyltransferase family 4 protein [Clostridium perfringens]EJT6160616.1 glycosyltransferase family 4 protein [Clostridium perfringens]MBP2860490.1 glycosyltransferase family 4 protein [Clostridium perfringens]
MKVVLVSEFFYPYKTSTQKILTELAEDFVEYGLEVDVLTTKNAYREEKQDLGKYEIYRGINIKRVFSTEGNRDSKIGRLLNYITFTTSVFFNLLFKKNYDKILFVSNPPLVPFIGYLIKKLRGKNYIYLVHDIYPDVAEKLGVIKKGSIISKVMNYMNKKIYTNAERIIALGKDMKSVIVDKGVDEEKIEIVTNWADSRVNYEKEVDKNFYKKYRLENKFNILYTGNISKVHAIDTIVEVAKILKNEEDIMFTFVGDGNRKQDLIKLKEKEDLRNIQLENYMFGEEYNNLLNCANLFITTLQQGIEGLGVPSKTYTYMSVAKPLIAIMSENSEIGSMVNQYNLGKQFNNKEYHKIAEFILELKNSNELYNEISKNVRNKFLNEYERKKVTNKFYKVINS